MATLPALSGRASLLHCEAWEGIPWLLHGFSMRTGGVSTVYRALESGQCELNLGFTAEDAEENVRRNRERLVEAVAGLSADEPSADPAGKEISKLVTLRQTHSATAHCVDRESYRRVSGAEGDGLLTGEPGLVLAIQTADCVPVLVVDPARRAVAAFHAGWRGSVGRIVEKGISGMEQAFGSRPEELSAAIGPCIRSCCYGVGEELRTAFRARFRYADSLFTAGEEAGTAGSLKLDLVEANRRQLYDAGLYPESVHVIGLRTEGCTGCHPESFFSYRASGGKTGRMMSVIGVRQE